MPATSVAVRVPSAVHSALVDLAAAAERPVSKLLGDILEPHTAALRLQAAELRAYPQLAPQLLAAFQAQLTEQLSAALHAPSAEPED